MGTNFKEELDKLILNPVELRESIKNVLEIQNTLFIAVRQIRKAQEENDARVETMKDLVVALTKEIADLKKQINIKEYK